MHLCGCIHCVLCSQVIALILLHLALTVVLLLHATVESERHFRLQRYVMEPGRWEARLQSRKRWDAAAAALDLDRTHGEVFPESTSVVESTNVVVDVAAAAAPKAPAAGGLRAEKVQVLDQKSLSSDELAAELAALKARITHVGAQLPAMLERASAEPIPPFEPPEFWDQWSAEQKSELWLHYGVPAAYVIMWMVCTACYFL